MAARAAAGAMPASNYDLVIGMRDAGDALAEYVVRLREALRPFAAHATVWPQEADNLTVSCRLHVEPAYEALLGTQDFRNARSAIEAVFQKAGSE